VTKERTLDQDLLSTVLLDMNIPPYREAFTKVGGVKLLNGKEETSEIEIEMPKFVWSKGDSKVTKYINPEELNILA